VKVRRVQQQGFTLVEIMIVVAIIALLAAIAVPSFLRARKRSQATAILQDLRILDGAVQQYAIENHKKSGDPVEWQDLVPYLKAGTRLATSNGRDMHGHEMLPMFGSVIVDDPRQIRICYATFDQLSDVAPLEFWEPYGVEER
jgi:prepilin-type N-terminal cleavage/methylation domain-containing protein